MTEIMTKEYTRLKREEGEVKIVFGIYKEDEAIAEYRMTWRSSRGKLIPNFEAAPYGIEHFPKIQNVLNALEEHGDGYLTPDAFLEILEFCEFVPSWYENK